MMNIFVSGAVMYYLSITKFIVLRGAFFLTVKSRKERLYDGIRFLTCFFIQDWIFNLDGKKRASVLEGFFRLLYVCYVLIFSSVRNRFLYQVLLLFSQNKLRHHCQRIKIKIIHL